ncbi:MAG: MBL fold metallo-hydrolase [Lachnospiraceae bacterium]|nr:MBL fold metallo-hydrolase [Lachnospiraceae bacterium]
MKLHFIGADHEVTGSAHFIKACGLNMLVDYGMEQGVNVLENEPLPVPASEINYVFLTHAHVDHSGMLPYLYALGFRGRIITTVATADLCSIMLRDCAHIQMQEAEWKSRKNKRGGDFGPAEPLYTMEDADGVIARIDGYDYNEKYNIAEGVDCRFTDIGHLLGSASIELWLTENGITKKLVFSGDIGNTDQPLIKDPEYTKDADVVVMESTYGNRYHERNRLDYVSELTAVLRETFQRGGNVVIPSFAVGRTQEMLYFIRQIKADRLLEEFQDFEVYVDSPLAVDATEIFKNNIYSCFDEEAMQLVNQGINPLTFPGLKLTITSEESKEINFNEKPKVIISASGMCEAGRIRHHLKHNLWREECTILFVGYQAVGTLGRKIVDYGADRDNDPLVGLDPNRNTIKLFGEAVEMNAHIKVLAGMSGHADKQGLTDWINAFEKQPERVFIVHGEDSVAEEFKEYLHNEYGHNSFAPYSGTIYDILTDDFDYVAEPHYIKETKKTEGGRKVSEVFARLLAAGNRLLTVINHNEGGTNKDLAKFADQINSLCDKWDR